MAEIILSQVPIDELVSRLTDAVLNKITSNVSNDDERLLSCEEARKVFVPAVSRQTIANWTRAGVLKSYRVSGRIYYKKSEIITAAKESKKYKKTG